MSVNVPVLLVRWLPDDDRKSGDKWRPIPAASSDDFDATAQGVELRPTYTSASVEKTTASTF
jgi:hypothetical protein